MIRAQLLVRYPRVIASARHRFYDLQSHLVERGVEASVHSLVSSVDGTGMVPRSISTLARAYWQRIGDAIRRPRPDVVVVQYEMLPYLPAWIELVLLGRTTPFVLDYDDAWFHHYDLHRSGGVRLLLGRKIERLIEKAAAVSVGSEYLHAYASRFNANVFRVPTSIDTEMFPAVPMEKPPGAGFTIGWIGSRTTAPFLGLVEGVLTRFIEETPGARVVTVGAGDTPLRIPGLVRRPWAEAHEAVEIGKFDVGIMPMPDTPFTRGKCAYKLLQYMACSKPTIASDVGENGRVVSHGMSGFLARSPDEWLEALRQLRDTPHQGYVMGRVGRAIVEGRYTRSVAAAGLAAAVHAAASRFG